MKLIRIPLPGAYVIEIEPVADERGFFARTWSAQEFKLHGLNPTLEQCSISFNKKCGTLRGMHYQAAPHGQTKIVRCTMGSIYDVIIDLRIGSPTFRQWVGVDLTAANRRMLYVPKEFAHGFQTLEDDTETFYQMSDIYVPESGRGVRWNDPAFGIVWPDAEERIINARDRDYPDFAQPSNWA